MAKHEGGHIHQVARAAGVDLETEQALQVQHAQPAGLTEPDFDRPFPLDGDECWYQVHANAADGRSEAGEAALQRV
jgi:hypothetical protein